MILYHKTEEEVLAWDDIQFSYFVTQARRYGAWLWNFFPPEIGGKDEMETKANALKLQEATPSLLLPSEAQFEDLREDSEFHGLIGPQG